MKACYKVNLVAFMLLLALPLEARERIVLSRPYSNSPAEFLATERIIAEVYSRIGKDVEFRVFPIARSLAMANNGNTDGESLRIAGIEQNYPNLVMVSVPLLYMDIVVFTKEVEFAVEGWQSLSPYAIGFVKGFKAAEINTRGMNVEIVMTIQQAFLKLNAGRSDVVVDFRNAKCMLPKLNLPDIKILEPPIVQIVMYTYLHKRHKDLVMKLEELLKHMEATGELKSMREKAVQEAQDSCQ